MSLRRSAEQGPLHALAARFGIQPSFTDSQGFERHASDDTLRELLSTMGADAATDEQAERSLAQVEVERAAECIEPVIVAWNGRAAPLRLRGVSGRISIRISQREPDIGVPQVSARDLTRDATRPVALPQLPFGYHKLEVESAGRTCTSLVISAPTKAHSHPRRRKSELAPWGVFLPLYAANSERSWGAGDFSDWMVLCRATREAGGSVVGTLPLMSAFLDKWKSEPSPYSPATRLFWNEFYVDPARSPDFLASKDVQRSVAAGSIERSLSELRSLPAVDYDRTMALKRRVLQPLADTCFRADSSRRRALEQFVASNPAIDSYAGFRATCERERRPWREWPQRMRDGHLLPRDYNESGRRFYLYAQWLAQEQIGHLLDETRRLGPQLYFDLPLGVNPDGFDVWRHRDSFVLGANVGAPPDAFFTKGQDWGFPPLHPRRIREQGYRYVIDYLRFQMRHAALLRIDHVMGLHRLWWVPRGASAAHGAYVRYHADEWYAILCLESHRHKTALAGENLGTVPPEVNRSMKRHGLRAMYVVQYEINDDAKNPLPAPAAESVSSINTHDMPTWAAYWQGLDIADRRELGLLNAPEVASEARRRMAARRLLIRFLIKEKLVGGKPGARSVLLGLLKFLRRTSSGLVLVNLEDVWLETSPQNTPGTSTERVNWRRKARYKIGEMFSRKEFADFFAGLNR